MLVGRIDLFTFIHFLDYIEDDETGLKKTMFALFHKGREYARGIHFQNTFVQC